MYDPMPKEPRNEELEMLELPIRAFNALRSWRPNITIRELDETPDEVLLAIPRMGRRSVRDIRDSVDAILGLNKAETRRLHEWVETHRALVLSLVRGEAVIVPMSSMKVARLELPWSSRGGYEAKS